MKYLKVTFCNADRFYLGVKVPITYHYEGQGFKCALNYVGNLGAKRRGCWQNCTCKSVKFGVFISSRFKNYAVLSVGIKILLQYLHVPIGIDFNQANKIHVNQVR